MMSTVGRDLRWSGDDLGRIFVAVRWSISTAHLLSSAGTVDWQQTSISIETAMQSMHFNGRLESQRMQSNQTTLKLSTMNLRRRPSASAPDHRSGAPWLNACEGCEALAERRGTR